MDDATFLVVHGDVREVVVDLFAAVSHLYVHLLTMMNYAVQI